MGDADLVERAVDECMRFLQLKVAMDDYGAELLSPSVRVDAAWHCLVLQTRDYERVLRSIHQAEGQPYQMVHHDADAALGAPEAKAARFQTTLKGYSARFGAVAPADVWDDVDAAAAAAGPPQSLLPPTMQIIVKRIPP